jgi:hypothetical protein
MSESITIFNCTLSVEVWKFLFDILKSFVIILGGIWALYKWIKFNREKTASWITSIYRDFNFSNEFKEIKGKLEYEYDDIKAIIEKILSGNQKLSKDEIHIMIDLDRFLNYLSLVAKLINWKQIKKNDINIGLEWWIFKYFNDKAELIEYIEKYRFTDLIKYIKKMK